MQIKYITKNDQVHIICTLNTSTDAEYCSKVWHEKKPKTFENMVYKTRSQTSHKLITQQLYGVGTTASITAIGIGHIICTLNTSTDAEYCSKVWHEKKPKTFENMVHKNKSQTSQKLLTHSINKSQCVCWLTK